MARAVIEITGDTSGLTRALARVPKVVQSAAAAIKGDFASAMREATAAAEATEKAHQAAARAMRAAARASSRVASEEERTRTRVAQQEAGYRTNAYNADAAAAEDSERRKTRAAKREADERRRVYARELEERRRAAGERGAQIGGFAAQVGSQAIGMTRSATVSAAGIETRINDALVPAGYRNPAELAAAHRAILARAQSSGIGADRMADALSNAQEFTSLLSGRTGAERSRNLAGALDDVDFAANSRQDIGQVLRLRGVLGQQGIRGADARSTMMALTGIGRAGSIELGNLTREALGPLMQNIAFATGRLGPNATAEQRSAAVRAATVRTLAVGEVGAAAGLSSRDALNALAKLDRYTLNPAAMGNLRERLMGRGQAGRALAAEMFESARDAGGNQIYRLRGRYTDSLQMSSALLRHTGGNSAEMANMLSSGGPGRAMVMDSQTRRLLLGLASQTQNGESISDRVSRMAGEANYTDADLAAERQIRMGEDTTRQTQNAETQRQALSDNTSQLNRLNKQLENAQAKHPVLMAAAGGAAVAAAPTAGRAIWQTISGTTASAVGGIGRFGARMLARTGAGIGALSDILRPSNDDQGYFDDAAAIRAARGGASGADATRAGQRANITELTNGMTRAVAQGVREGMATAPVQVPPAAQQHATTQAGLANGTTPTTRR
jgi:hypothetical protein